MTDGATAAAIAESPVLVISCAGNAPYTAQAIDSPITVGRELSTQIRIDDERISGIHLVITLTANTWSLTDSYSTNGTFHAGKPVNRLDITDGLTIHLGNPDSGIPVTFTLAAGDVSGAGRPVLDATSACTAPRDVECPGSTESLSTGVSRVGANVTVRREELGLSIRHLADAAECDTSLITSLERGEAWPDEEVRSRLEQALLWPAGTLLTIRQGGEDPINTDTSTEVLSSTVRTAVFIDSLAVELAKIRGRIVRLPDVSSATFPDAAATHAAALRHLITDTTAARSAMNDAGLIFALSDLRRTYADLMTHAATSPHAPLSHRLFAARHAAQLTCDEVAAAAGVSAHEVIDAEDGATLPASTAQKLAAFAEALAERL